MGELDDAPRVEPTHAEKLQRLVKLKEVMRAKDEEAKHARDEHDYYQAKLFDEMRDQGLYTARTDDGTFTCKSTAYGNINDMEAFTAWASEKGLLEEFIKDAPVKRRLNEFVKSCLDNGEELPPGVNWYAREYISITKD